MNCQNTAVVSCTYEHDTSSDPGSPAGPDTTYEQDNTVVLQQRRIPADVSTLIDVMPPLLRLPTREMVGAGSSKVTHGEHVHPHCSTRK